MKHFKKLIPVLLVAVIAAVGYALWDKTRDHGFGEAFISGNGRIEATEIDISTKLAGRIERIFASEGDYVKAGDLLAVMQTSALEAQLDEAQAQYQKAITAEINAKAQVSLRESDKRVAQAIVAQRLSDLDAAQRRFNRSRTLAQKGAIPIQEFDDDETGLSSTKAAVTSARAQVSVTQAAIDAAKAEVSGARAAIRAAQATVARIQSDIRDCGLTAPRSGRIQYRIAQPGEVLGAGGKLMNLVDLSDVYMTFFLPETAVGKVHMSDDVRIVLDALPESPIPAKISYVANVAQFTPKTVETQSERQKLMFRVKAQISPELLQKHLDAVKTGLPGVTWVKLDPKAEWPAPLTLKKTL